MCAVHINCKPKQTVNTKLEGEKSGVVHTESHYNFERGHTIGWLFAWIVNDQAHHFDDRIETVQRVTNVFDGQIIGHVQHEQRKGLLRSTRDGHLTHIVYIV